jgi:hypothetical protein
MRFVALKAGEQQDLQPIHRLGSRLDWLLTGIPIAPPPAPQNAEVVIDERDSRLTPIRQSPLCIRCMGKSADSTCGLRAQRDKNKPGFRRKPTRPVMAIAAVAAIARAALFDNFRQSRRFPWSCFERGPVILSDAALGISSQNI